MRTLKMTDKLMSESKNAIRQAALRIFGRELDLDDIDMVAISESADHAKIEVTYLDRR